jgi:hypothetical protein
MYTTSEKFMKTETVSNVMDKVVENKIVGENVKDIVVENIKDI